MIPGLPQTSAEAVEAAIHVAVAQEMGDTLMKLATLPVGYLGRCPLWALIEPQIEGQRDKAWFRHAGFIYWLVRGGVEAALAGGRPGAAILMKVYDEASELVVEQHLGNSGLQVVESEAEYYPLCEPRDLVQMSFEYLFRVEPRLATTDCAATVGGRDYPLFMVATSTIRKDAGTILRDVDRILEALPLPIEVVTE